MIARYTRPEMGHIWSDQNKFRTWLEVELAATETLAEAGLVPQSAAVAIREKGDFDLDRINQIEAEVKHDVIAFTTAVAEKVGPESRWLHYGLTSNDVVDTAQALLIKQASAIIREDLKKLREVLKRRAWEFKDTPHDRPHSRRARRAHHFWVEAGQLVFRDAAQYRALRAGSRADARRQAVGRRRQRRASRSGVRREDLPAPGTERRSRIIAGDSARPPCVLRRDARGHRLDPR